jgi:hypothetical protein
VPETFGDRGERLRLVNEHKGNQRFSCMSRSRPLWVLADVLGLFSFNVGPFSRNVGPGDRIFSSNVGRHRPMLSGRTVYVLRSLQIAMIKYSLQNRKRMEGTSAVQRKMIRAGMNGYYARNVRVSGWL